MEYQLYNVHKTDYHEIVELWEASVRATHHFLKEEDIQYFKPLILNTYLDAVKLKCIKSSNNRIIGFLGVASRNLEMLFIHPQYRGKQIGKVLLTYALENLAVTKVDVNEQNEEAVGFYQHFGFEIVKRSKVDATGKPYPILHMELLN